MLVVSCIARGATLSLAWRVCPTDGSHAILLSCVPRVRVGGEMSSDDNPADRGEAFRRNNGTDNDILAVNPPRRLNWVHVLQQGLERLFETRCMQIVSLIRVATPLQALPAFRGSVGSAVQQLGPILHPSVRLTQESRARL